MQSWQEKQALGSLARSRIGARDKPSRSPEFVTLQQVIRTTRLPRQGIVTFFTILSLLFKSLPLNCQPPFRTVACPRCGCPLILNPQTASVKIKLKSVPYFRLVRNTVRSQLVQLPLQLTVTPRALKLNRWKLQAHDARQELRCVTFFAARRNGRSTRNGARQRNAKLKIDS
jgi:hypothetical protein